MDDGYENTYEYPFPMTCVNRNLPMEPANQTSVDVKPENKTPVWKMVVASILFLCISVALSVAAVMLVFRFQKTNGEELPSMNANMESMTSKSVNLSAEISDLKAMIGRQKTEISITQHTVQKLSASSAVQKLEMRLLENVVNDTANNISSLEEQYSTNQEKITNLESQITSLQNIINEMLADLNSTKTENMGIHFKLTDLELAVFKRVRLAGSDSKSYGRVEIFMYGSWGTVCDDSWDINDGNVICKQLGYSRATSTTSSAKFGGGTGGIWMDDVECSGNEKSIEFCTYNKSHNCGHYEDAGVYCE